MRIELSIKTTYLPLWRTKEGVREVLQNAKDAETEFKAPMKVWHNGTNLIIENKCVSLPHEALLLGHTTKLENPNLIGHFGEGLKVGVLALTRAGHTIKILSGEEIWKPILVRSSSFQAEVLAFDIIKGKDCGGVIVEIGQIPISEWNEMRSDFLFLSNDVDKVSVEDYGELLLAPSMAGKIFVKGIFVQHEPKFQCGYNLFNAPTDRDRKVVAQWELGWRLAKIWAGATSNKLELVSKLYDMLSSGAKDTEDFSSYTAEHLSKEAKDGLLAIFTRTFGKNAVPVASLLESKDLGHLGRDGIVLPAPMAKLLQSIMGLEGGITALMSKIGSEIVARHSWLELTEEERNNLEAAIETISLAGDKVPFENLEVVSFCSNRQNGMWKAPKIFLSKTILSNKAQTLSTLIHEHAHHLTEKGDGDKSHIANIERIWRDIYAALTKEKV